MTYSTALRTKAPRAAALLIGLPLIITLAILAFAWPAARLQPRNIPVGIVGAPAARNQFVSAVSMAQPGKLALRHYSTVGSAQSAVKDRDIYGAFVVSAGRLQILDASAAGPVVAQFLGQVGHTVAAHRSVPGAPPVAVTTIDVVRLSSNDAKGSIFSSALLPITICGLIAAAAAGLVIRVGSLERHLASLTAVAALAGAGMYLVVQGWLGALPNDPIADWASLSLIVLAVSAATAGVIALLGAAGLGVAAAVFVFVGNPFSGVTSAPKMLPAAADHLGQWLPPGAGASLLRSTAYFGDNAAGDHVAVLLAWALAGFAAIVLARVRAARSGAGQA